MMVRPLAVIDPLVHGQKVLPRVYNEQTNERLVRRFREGRAYGVCTTIDVIGCNMLCSYCYVDDSFLTGRGNLLEKEQRQGKVKFYTPQKLVDECICTIAANNMPKRIQITAAEPFLTPDWLIEVIRLFRPFLERHNELMWIDTNGVDIVQNPGIADKLVPFRNFLRLFVSSKHHPDHYSAMTRVNSSFADTGFQCLELLWKKQISAFLQAPMSILFFQDTFKWYLDRLLQIHPVAPLLMDLDRLSFLPLARIRTGLTAANLWDRMRKESGPKNENEWQKFLESHYKRKIDRLISVDSFPEDEKLVRELVFEGKPLEKCYLFEKENV